MYFPNTCRHVVRARTQENCRRQALTVMQREGRAAKVVSLIEKWIHMNTRWLTACNSVRSARKTCLPAEGRA